MRTISRTIPGAFVLFLALSLASGIQAQAQPSDAAQTFPADLVQISPADASALLSVGRLFRMSSYPNDPPLPPPVLFLILGLAPDGSGSLDSSGSATNYAVYFSASVQGIFLDDRAAVAETMLAQAAMNGNRMMSQADDPDQQDDSDSPTLDTTQLYLEITNVDTVLAYFNLHNGTNQVYAIWSTTNLASGWSVATEVWPTNADVMPFTVPTSGQDNLFLLAEDWTGVTENGNTTPDWWFWQYFGTVALSDTNLDSQGTNTLLYDYTNGLDPNVITFAVSADSNYLNQSTVPVQLVVSAGVPVSMAVLLDSTNFAAATWTDFNPNPTVNLGTSQGWHDVWFGLRGRLPTSQQTWQWMRFKLDYTPPALVITNPVILTISQPLVQVQGYCTKPLASLSCNLSNAVGVASNQTALVVDQYYDTNTWEFTTNYFQVFDLELTNGPGLYTALLYATDLAGNTSVTSFTLALTNDTAPPIITLGWPQTGQMLCGQSFTVDGWLDDPSASVQLSWVDTNSVTNTFAGLVERDGRFWVENVPLADATNVFALTATDAWGNSATTNITVCQSSLTLGITPIDPNQLFQPTVSLTGTVSDPTCTVWVNGIQATNNGDGTWQATGVPVTPGGTASFVVSAYPAGHDLQADAASLAKINDDLPDRLYVESDHQSLATDDHTYWALLDQPDWGDNEEHYEYTHYWEDGAGGSAEWLSKAVSNGPLGGTSNLCTAQIVWAPTQWPDLTNGTQTAQGGCDWASMYAVETTSPPNIGMEHCEVSDPKSSTWSHFWDGVGWEEGWNRQTYERHAQTKLKLFTGGKALPGQKNLFAINGWARELLVRRAGPPYAYTHDGVVSYPFPWSPLPNTSVSIGELGALGSDGFLYTALPNRVTKNVTPLVRGKQFYWFNVTRQKCHPYITLTAGPNSANLDTATPEVCVGQQVNFELDWDTTPPNIVDTKQQWTLPPKYVNESYQYSDTCETFRQNGRWLTNNPTWCWYVNQPGGRVSMWQNLHFSNGQYVSVAAEGNFTVYRPSVNPLVPFGPYAAGDPTDDWLSLENGPMRFDVSINSKYLGKFGLTQLVNYYAQTIVFPPDVFIFHTTWGSFWLDGAEYYDGPKDQDQTCSILDAPGIALGIEAGSYDGDWKDYVRFMPDGGIAVTLGRVDWSWAATCINTNPIVSDTQLPSGWTLTSDGVDDPTPHDDDSFPLWSHVKPAPDNGQ
jgi:hypothetical protein